MKKKSITVNIDSDVHEQLVQIAQTQNRSLSSLIAYIVARQLRISQPPLTNPK